MTADLILRLAAIGVAVVLAILATIIIVWGPRDGVDDDPGCLPIAMMAIAGFILLGALSTPVTP